MRVRPEGNRQGPQDDRDGVLSRILAVVKMRDSQHSKSVREYHIADKGVRLTGCLNEYRALIAGIPTHWMQSGSTEEP